MGFQIVKIFSTSVGLWRSKVKVKPLPKKFRNTFIPVYSIHIHIQNPHKKWVVPCWLHWLLQYALCCYQTAKARTLCVYRVQKINLKNESFWLSTTLLKKMLTVFLTQACRVFAALMSGGRLFHACGPACARRPGRQTMMRSPTAADRKHRPVLAIISKSMATLYRNIQPSVRDPGGIGSRSLSPFHESHRSLSPVVLLRRNHACAIVLDPSRSPIHILTGLDVASRS